MGAACPYVSRGGLKLEKALRDFGVKTEGVCAAIPARPPADLRIAYCSTGEKVFAIDVGYGQLD